MESNIIKHQITCNPCGQISAGSLLRLYPDWKKIMNMDFDTNLFSDLLVKMDIATMAHSSKAGARSWERTIGIRTYAERFIKDQVAPPSSCSAHWPKNISRRFDQPAQTGLWDPFEKWIDHELRDMIQDYVGSPSAYHRSFIKPAFTEQLLPTQPLFPLKKGPRYFGPYSAWKWYKRSISLDTMARSFHAGLRLPKCSRRNINPFITLCLVWPGNKTAWYWSVIQGTHMWFIFSPPGGQGRYGLLRYCTPGNESIRTGLYGAWSNRFGKRETDQAPWFFIAIGDNRIGKRSRPVCSNTTVSGKRTPFGADRRQCGPVRTWGHDRGRGSHQPAGEDRQRRYAIPVASWTWMHRGDFAHIGPGIMRAFPWEKGVSSGQALWSGKTSI